MNNAPRRAGSTVLDRHNHRQKNNASFSIRNILPKRLLLLTQLVLLAFSQTVIADSTPNTSWALSAIESNGERYQLTPSTHLTLVINSDNSAQGMVLCNKWRGEQMIESNHITISSTRTTRDQCQEPNPVELSVASRYLERLEGRNRYQIDNEELILHLNAGPSRWYFNKLP